MTPWIAVTVVSRSSTRALIETFMTLASMVMRNCARASTASTPVAPERRPSPPFTASPEPLCSHPVPLHPIRTMCRSSRPATLGSRRGCSVRETRAGGHSNVVLVRRGSRLYLDRVLHHPGRGDAPKRAHPAVHPPHLSPPLLGP